jgi:hypothetical protein
MSEEPSVTAVEEESPSRAAAATGEVESQLSQKLMIKERIRAGVEGRSRQDCVLIKTPTRIARGRPDSMSGKRVAKVLAFFQCEVFGVWHKLAYVSWFETRGKDPVTGLFHLKRTSKSSVIQVDDIERGVHLIPKFGHQVGATVWKKRLVEQGQRALTLRSPDGDSEAMQGGVNSPGDGNSRLVRDDSGDSGAGSATLKVKHWIDVWPHYDEYWLNTWSDDAIYKLIY